MTESKKGKRGRPTSYSKKYARLAYNLAKFGANESEIASIFKVSRQTLSKWKRDFPELLDSICRGKKDGIFNAKKSIYRRATGYRYSEVTKQRVEIERENDEGETEKVPAIVTKTVSKHMAPDVNACLSILKNSKTKEW